MRHKVLIHPSFLWFASYPRTNLYRLVLSFLLPTNLRKLFNVYFSLWFFFFYVEFGLDSLEECCHFYGQNQFEAYCIFLAPPLSVDVFVSIEFEYVKAALYNKGIYFLFRVIERLKGGGAEVTRNGERNIFKKYK